MTFGTSAAAHANTDHPDASWYMALLERYAAGDTEGAVRGVLEADPERLDAAYKESFDAIDRALNGMSSRNALGDDQSAKGTLERQIARDRRRELLRRCRLTALLHTEALIRSIGPGQVPLFVRLSRRPIEMMIDLRNEFETLGPVNDPPADLLTPEARSRRGLTERHLLRSFCRQWFLVATAWLHGQGYLTEAKQLVDRALHAFDNDAELRLARGSVFESSAATRIVDRSAADELYSKLELRERRLLLDAAARDLERALAAAPDLTEAALRLARVRQLLGDPVRARPVLDAVGSDAAPFLRYHAHLFLGELDEQAGDAARAAKHFTEALVVMPVAQAPALALSRLSDASGNTADAKRWLARSLVAVSSDRDDPWWRYAKGQSWLLQERFQRLQEMPFP